MLLNSSNLTGLYTGFKANFQAGFAGATSTYMRVATTVPSTTRTEEYGWLGQFPRIREWVGERVVNQLGMHQYAIRNKPWEMTVKVDRDDIEDDRFGIYAPMMTEMGRATAAFPDELVWPALAAGNTALCYDGQNFFDTDHPVLGADGQTASVSNWGGGAGPFWALLDTTRALKPIIFQQRRAFDFQALNKPSDPNVFMLKEFIYGVEGRGNVGYGLWQMAYGSRQPLDPTSYEAARVAMTSMKGDNGRPLGLRPNLLVVSPQLEGAGRRLVTSEKLATNEDNPWRGTAELHVEPYLA